MSTEFYQGFLLLFLVYWLEIFLFPIFLKSKGLQIDQR